MKHSSKIKEGWTHFSSSVRRFSSGVMLSRLTGLGRDLSMAYAFGAHPSVAALLVAFRFAHLLRRLFGEGAVHAAFIPQFERLKQEREESAYHFFRQLTLALAVAVLAVTFLLEFGLGGTLLWASLRINNREVIYLLCWLLPSLLFICLYALNSAFLHCYRSFFLANSAPAACNLIWIGAALSLRSLPPSRAMPILAKWIVGAVAAQWMLTALPIVWKMQGKRERWPKERGKKELTIFTRAVAFGIVGVGATQLNSFLDALFSRYSELEGPVYLWYAIRCYHIPIALFGLATVQTLIPPLSRALQQGAFDEGKRLFVFGMRRLAVAMAVLTGGLCAASFPLIDLLFGWGQFSSDAVMKTAACLVAYAAGLFPSVAVVLCAAVYYGEGNFRVPMWFSLGAVAFNAALNALLILGFGLGPVSVAASTSASAWCQFLGLRALLARRGWPLGLELKAALQLGGVIGGALLAAQAYQHVFLPSSKLLAFFASSGIFGVLVGTYGALGRHVGLRQFFLTYLGWSRKAWNKESD